MNDLVTPFLAVFLGEHLHGPINTWQVSELSEVSPAHLLPCAIGGEMPLTLHPTFALHSPLSATLGLPC